MKVKFVAEDINCVSDHSMFWVENNDGTRSPISILAECIRRVLEESRNKGMKVAVDGLLYETGGDANPSNWDRHQEMKRRVLTLHQTPPETVIVQVWGSTLTWTRDDNVVAIEGARCSIADWWGQTIGLAGYKLEVTGTSTPWLAPWETMRGYTLSLIKAEALMRDRFDIVQGMESHHPELTMSNASPTKAMEEVYREMKEFFLPGHETEKAWRQAKEAVARYVREMPNLGRKEFVLPHSNKKPSVDAGGKVQPAAEGIDLGVLA